MLPSLEVICVDTVGKKAAFVRQALLFLGAGRFRRLFGDGRVQPFAERQAGAPGRILGGFAGVLIDALDAPRDRVPHVESIRSPTGKRTAHPVRIDGWLIPARRICEGSCRNGPTCTLGHHGKGRVNTAFHVNFGFIPLAVTISLCGRDPPEEAFCVSPR